MPPRRDPTGQRKHRLSRTMIWAGMLLEADIVLQDVRNKLKAVRA